MTRRAQRGRNTADAVASPRAAGLRLDKWLWAARLYKTRALASEAIEAGQVRVDGERAKAARIVEPGDRVDIRRGGLSWDLLVAAVDDRRGPASAAAALYREDPQSLAKRQAAIAERRAAAEVRTPGRPTKRDRRALEDFLNEP